MQIHSVLKKSSFVLIILVGVIVGGSVYAGVNKILPQQSMAETNTHLPKNAFGETYGSARDVSPYEREPDLIKARGINGKTGYIRLSEVNGEDPKTPEEALAQEVKDKGREINVYESDGKTVIDKFVIGKGEQRKENN